MQQPGYQPPPYPPPYPPQSYRQPDYNHTPFAPVKKKTIRSIVITVILVITIITLVMAGVVWLIWQLGDPPEVFGDPPPEVLNTTPPVTSPSNNDSIKLPEQEVIRFAIFPSGATFETYYFVLAKDAVLTCSMGVRISDDITQPDFLESTETSAEKQLSADDYDTLIEMAYVLDASGYKLKKIEAEDSWNIALVFNGKIYETDYWIEDKAIALIDLADKFIELSPVEVILQSWS